MLNDMYLNLSNEIEAERKQREYTEATILRLLEDTCRRVEVTINNWMELNEMHYVMKWDL